VGTNIGQRHRLGSLAESIIYLHIFLCSIGHKTKYLQVQKTYIVGYEHDKTYMCPPNSCSIVPLGNKRKEQSHTTVPLLTVNLCFSECRPRLTCSMRQAYRLFRIRQLRSTRLKSVGTFILRHIGLSSRLFRGLIPFEVLQRKFVYLQALVKIFICIYCLIFNWFMTILEWYFLLFLNCTVESCYFCSTLIYNWSNEVFVTVLRRS
jgi:hypothetical protein